MEILQQGIAAYKESDYYKAIRYFDEIRSKEKFVSNENLYQAESYRGDSYYKMANYIEAMKSYKECVNIAERLDDKKSICEMLYKIVSIYAAIEDFDAARETAIKLRDIANELNDRYILCKTYNAFGAIFIDDSSKDDKNMLKEGIKSLKAGLEYAKDTDFVAEKAKLNANLGEAYCKLGMPEKGIKYLETALGYGNQLSDKGILGYIELTIALSYYGTKEFDTALIYANKAILNFKDISERLRIADTYQLFSKIHRGKGDYESALEYYMHYAELMIEIRNKEYIRTISNMKKEYDLLKIEKDNEIYKIKNEELATVNKKLKKAYEEVNRLSQNDYLTGIFNRRGIKNRIAGLNNEKENGIILLDIDYFKSVNDSFGHDTGDQILKEVVSRIVDIKERDYIIGRWGGEEFLVILPDKGLDETFMFAEEVSNIISGKGFKAANIELRITVTTGIDIFGKGIDFETAIKSVDKKLYVGKNLGRNKNIK